MYGNLDVDVRMEDYERNQVVRKTETRKNERRGNGTYWR